MASSSTAREEPSVITFSREFSPDRVHVGDSDVANLVKKVDLLDAWGLRAILGISFLWIAFNPEI